EARPIRSAHARIPAAVASTIGTGGALVVWSGTVSPSGNRWLIGAPWPASVPGVGAPRPVAARAHGRRTRMGEGGAPPGRLSGRSPLVGVVRISRLSRDRRPERPIEPRGERRERQALLRGQVHLVVLDAHGREVVGDLLAGRHRPALPSLGLRERLLGGLRVRLIQGGTGLRVRHRRGELLLPAGGLAP